MLASLALMLAQVPEQPITVAPPAKAKLICREDERQVGSHIHTGRRCKTADEWRAEDERVDPSSSPSMRITDRQRDELSPRTRPQ